MFRTCLECVYVCKHILNMLSFSTLYTAQKSLLEFALRGMPPSPAHITSACTPFLSHTLSSLTCTTASHTKLSYSCSLSFILIAHAGIRCMQPSTFQILHVEMQVRRAYVRCSSASEKKKGCGRNAVQAEGM